MSASGGRSALQTVRVRARGGHRLGVKVISWFMQMGHRTPAGAGVETTAQLWTEDRRALEVDIHKEKTRDHENWEPDLLSQVARLFMMFFAFGARGQCEGCLRC